LVDCVVLGGPTDQRLVQSQQGRNSAAARCVQLRTHRRHSVQDPGFVFVPSSVAVFLTRLLPKSWRPGLFFFTQLVILVSQSDLQWPLPGFKSEIMLCVCFDLI
jgi:hypothetical protein